MTIDGKIHNKAAHRVAYEEAHGPIPDGLWVLHRCDNKMCVRVDHLFLGTNKQNQKDSVIKGLHRFGVQRGEANGNSKLTKEQVVEIRRLARESRRNTYAELGRRFGVSGGMIGRIVRREFWKKT